jgi:hypothetical protein
VNSVCVLDSLQISDSAKICGRIAPNADNRGERQRIGNSMKRKLKDPQGDENRFQVIGVASCIRQNQKAGCAADGGL